MLTLAYHYHVVYVLYTIVVGRQETVGLHEKEQTCRYDKPVLGDHSCFDRLRDFRGGGESQLESRRGGLQKELVLKH